MKKLLFLALPLLVLVMAFRSAFLHTVSGTITDQNGNPVPLVMVTETGTTNQTAADQNGHYQLAVNNSKGKLTFAAVGFSAQTVKINGRGVIDVILKASANQLSEVVVTGLGLSQNDGVAVYDAGKRSKMLLNSRAAGVVVNGYASTSTSGHFNTEDYDHIDENGFQKVADHPLSTFSIDVDAASYSNVRRFINEGQLPPAGAVRIEEMINYFRYDYPAPSGEHPFSITTELADCPWNNSHQLLLIGLQGKKLPTDDLPPSNLVFLIDVSGSMNDPKKLPLVKTSLKLLVDQLREKDKLSIVVYAGAAGMVLPPTNGSQKMKISEAIQQLQAGGSTAGGEGIKLAYKTAKVNFIKGGNNRVILCTDGDFNVGMSSDDELETLIEEERKSGVYLTVLGYGMGNYKDNKMQKLADKGNGNHAYIDGLSEAKKVLVKEFGSTLFTIAKDVKLQLEFNPANVQGYRLIGYENRMLKDEDFNDDKKDAGELGSGHTVTALYEIIPVGVKSSFLKDVDELKYQKKSNEQLSATSEMATVKFRYKLPAEDDSKKIEHLVLYTSQPLQKASENFRFAAAVAQFGMLLRESEFKGTASFDDVVNLAITTKGKYEEGYRKEFIQLVQKAAALKGESDEVVDAD